MLLYRATGSTVGPNISLKQVPHHCAQPAHTIHPRNIMFENITIPFLKREGEGRDPGKQELPRRNERKHARTNNIFVDFDVLY